MNVYYRRINNKLGCIHVDLQDAEEAIFAVKCHLQDSKEIRVGAALAFIKGGKYGT